jgi:hypothetical protein
VPTLRLTIICMMLHSGRFALLSNIASTTFPACYANV